MIYARRNWTRSQVSGMEPEAVPEAPVPEEPVSAPAASGGESLPDFSVPVLPRTAQEWKLGADLILYRFLGYSLVQRSLYGPEEYGRGIFLLRRISNRF